MRHETITFEGPSAEWNPDDQERFAALAGSRLLRVEDGNAIVAAGDGHETTVYPGWVVILPEGGRPVFSAPDRVRVTGG